LLDSAQHIKEDIERQQSTVIKQQREDYSGNSTDTRTLLQRNYLFH